MGRQSCDGWLLRESPRYPRLSGVKITRVVRVDRANVDGASQPKPCRQCFVPPANGRPIVVSRASNCLADL